MAAVRRCAPDVGWRLARFDRVTGSGLRTCQIARVEQTRLDRRLPPGCYLRRLQSRQPPPRGSAERPRPTHQRRRRVGTGINRNCGPAEPPLDHLASFRDERDLDDRDRTIV